MTCKVSTLAGAFVGLLWLAATTGRAQEYSVAPLMEPAPSGELSAEMAPLLAEHGVKVLKGKRTLCQIWLTKVWATTPGFTASQTVLYPFNSGALIGVAEYQSMGGDFRGQEIPPGMYTLRYAQQPVDGNHVGTSDTRDFLLLLPASSDTLPAELTPEQLIEQSKQAAQSNHPAMLCLQVAEGEATELPAVEHDTDRELWSLRVEGQSQSGDAMVPLPIKLVVVGKAAE